MPRRVYPDPHTHIEAVSQGGRADSLKYHSAHPRRRRDRRRPERGVVDARQRVFGYRNLLVCDGAAVPANVGVNPSLTITALAEHAMSHIPAAHGRSEPTRIETVPAASVRAHGEGTSTRSPR